MPVTPLQGPSPRAPRPSGGSPPAAPDFGVLDTNLRDGSSRALARELIRRRVSFVVYSGYRQTMNNVAEFEHAPWIEKPSPAGTLTQALAGLRNAKLRP